MIDLYRYLNKIYFLQINSFLNKEYIDLIIKNY